MLGLLVIRICQANGERRVIMRVDRKSGQFDNSRGGEKKKDGRAS